MSWERSGMSHETWVVNASPLIALAKVGQLQLLERPASCC
jgi:hypothetical protein